MNDITIYGLRCPIAKRIVYIGATRQPLKKRWMGHVSTCNNWEMCKWIGNLRRANKIDLVQIIEIDTCTKRASRTRETYWIKYYQEMAPLFNRCYKGSAKFNGQFLENVLINAAK